MESNIQPKHIKQLINEVFNGDIISKIKDLSAPLQEIKLRGRPEKPTTVELSNPEEFEVYRKRYSAVLKGDTSKYPDISDIQAERSSLESHDLYPYYLQYQLVNNWRRYKSEEYSHLNDAVRKYMQLLSYDNVALTEEDMKDLEKKGLPTNSFAIRDELERLRNLNSFSLFYDRKQLSSRKYRCSKSAISALKYLAQQIGQELLECGTEEAYRNDCKTVKIEHLLNNNISSYSTYPIFSRAQSYLALASRERRRAEWHMARKVDYTRISKTSQAKVDLADRFEGAELASGFCWSERKVGKTGKEKILYHWYNINTEEGQSIVPTVTRFAAEVKKKKGPAISQIKVGAEIKAFIAAIIRQSLSKVLEIIKLFLSNKKSITISAGAYDSSIKLFIELGKETSDDKIYSHLYWEY